MSTINISLPHEQIRLVDRFVTSYGFANRSEFIRSLLRLFIHKPGLIETASTFPFIAPREKSAEKIIAGFKETGKYSKAFLKDLKEGLESSDYFIK
jgi:hypothetical protein